MAAPEPAAPALPLPLPTPIPAFVAPAAWRAIDFISDLHLSEGTPHGFAAWAGHLRHTPADAVFILGDLFEAWVGDDLTGRGFEARCAQVLADASAARTIAFMAGNRDFLLGDAMLRASGVLRLHDPTLLNAFDGRVLLTHGDALCLGDTAYQRYRAVVRRPWVQRAFLALPLHWRLGVGRALRRGGRRADAGPMRLVDVDPAASAGWLRGADVPILVHGHTHAPASHPLAGGAVRHVLSDWDLDGSGPPRAEVLRWDAGGFRRIAPSGPDDAIAGAP